MATKRLIDANAIKYRMHMECYGHGLLMEEKFVTKEQIDKMPTVDAVEVVHGRWILADDGDGNVCSVCEMDFCNIIYETGNWNYCPNCGAKVDGGGDYGI